MRLNVFNFKLLRAELRINSVSRVDQHYSLLDAWHRFAKASIVWLQAIDPQYRL